MFSSLGTLSSPRLFNRNAMQTTFVILGFLVASFKKKKEIDLKNTFYSTHYIQNIISSSCNQYKNYFTFFLNFQIPMCNLYFILPNFNAKFSLGILDLYLEFIKFTMEKVDSHTQVMSNIFKTLPIIELSITFSI